MTFIFSTSFSFLGCYRLYSIFLSPIFRVQNSLVGFPFTEISPNAERQTILEGVRSW